MGFFGGGAAAGIGGSTGATDNAILRADGTGAATLQNSDLNVDDATTTTQNNVAITNQHSGQTNSAIVLTPKGTGALIAGPKPDGTATGGNARGPQAVDLQLARGSSGQVASGDYAFAAVRNATASASDAIAIGLSCNSSAFSGVAIGRQNTSQSNDYATCIGGAFNTSSGQAGICIGGQSLTASAAYSSAIGQAAVADRRGIFSSANGSFAANGDAQSIRTVLRCKTTTNSAVEMFLDGSSIRLTVPSGKVMSMIVNITGVRSTGAEVAHYVRQYSIKNVAGTTSEVYAPVTIGTDTAAGTSIALSANDTNDALKIECTGVASQTWRWVASVDAVEVAYGT